MADPKGLERIVGTSPNALAARDFARREASTSHPLLILGPAGSGRLELARAIHECGPRSEKPFSSFSFREWDESRVAGETGTVCLSGVESLSLSEQGRLLERFSDSSFFPRFIGLASGALSPLVERAVFRADLLAHLNRTTFEVTPLGVRKEDIPRLTDVLWKRLSQKSAKVFEIPGPVLEALVSYSFPGNHWELKMVLERLCLQASLTGRVDLDGLPSEIQALVAGRKAAIETSFAQVEKVGLNQVLDQIEGAHVLEAMERTNHNQIRAAALLKLTRGTLQYKLKRHGYRNLVRPAQDEAA